MAERILITEYSEEMQKSYLDYSMSVITARAIPDARDGLKPVQRRVLYDMSELRIQWDKPHRKSARIVGDTMGKYHPHGDSSIYETLVVMSQPWKKSLPLVDGHGNFGSIEGDGAAAMRYTEAKLQRFTEEVFLKDLDKTVDFVSNYDETETEPAVLPVRVPNLLLNGAEGIAVGMTTSIPTHNLQELCNACIAYINDTEISVEDLLRLMPGPDFPTGAIIANGGDLKEIYETGTGKLKLRGKIEVEMGRKRSDKDRLVVTEIPYTMVGSGINKFLQDVAGLVESKKLPEITDISNQSDKSGTRIVFELKKDADIDRIKSILYKKTKLEDSFGVHMLAIGDGRPRTLGLKDILSFYLSFQYENNQKKYTAMLQREMEKKEVQGGLIQAVDCIDLIIAVLRGSKNLADAKACLMEGKTAPIRFRHPEDEKAAALFSFSERQAQAILDMRLYRLIGLEIEVLLKEHKKTLKNIKDYEKILSSKTAMDQVIVSDLEYIRDEYGFPRKTVITEAEEIRYEEAPVPDEEYIFAMDRFGYCKLIDKNQFERSTESAATEYHHIFPIMNKDKLLVFTDSGTMYQAKAADIPVVKMRDKGIPIDNITKYDGKEKILFITAAGAIAGHRLLFVTEKGLVKQVEASEFSTNNRQVAATKLSEGDRLIRTTGITREDTDLVLVSDAGYFLRFPLAEIGLLKKTGKGEKGMRLKEKERLTGAYLLSEAEIIPYKDTEIRLSGLRRGHRNDRGSRTNVRS